MSSLWYKLNRLSSRYRTPLSIKKVINLKRVFRLLLSLIEMLWYLFGFSLVLIYNVLILNFLHKI